MKAADPKPGSVLPAFFLDGWFPLWEHNLVRVISRRAIQEFVSVHAEALEPLDHWYRVARRAAWRSLVEVRLDFPHADGVGKYTVFNIAGNKVRLIVTIKYQWQVVYIRHILTHA
jgi:mRNA interferase HigB